MVALIEGQSALFENFGAHVGRCLVTLDVTRTVPVRILNPTDKLLQLPRKLVIAAAHEVGDIQEDDVTGLHDQAGWDDHPPATRAWDALNIDETDLSASQVSEAKLLVEQFRDVFAMSSGELGRTPVMQHRINTGNAPPIMQPPRRLPWEKREETRNLVEKMVDQGIVEPSTSPWSSPIVLVTKKDGTTRFCVDYRRLNAITVKDPFPLPRIDDTLDALGGAAYFSTLDLCSGYHQLPMDPKDQEKTAFSTPDGHYEFNVLPFGVCNGPSAFQRMMSLVLSGLQWKVCLTYIDDVIVFSKTFSEHLSNLREVFIRLRTAQLRLKPSKCFLFRSSVEFLGHIVTREGIKTDPNKIARVRNWPKPQTVGEVRSFLGFCSYYRRYVQDFAAISRPLYHLTKASQRFQWTTACENAFQSLKGVLTTAPVLAYPEFGANSSSFILDVDASGTGIGAVLSQVQKGVERPIAFASRVISETEQRYPSTKVNCWHWSGLSAISAVIC